MNGQKQQSLLIVLLLVVTGFFLAFTYRELFPAYKSIQKGYQKIEQFKAEKQHSRPPPFKEEVKQIVLKQENNAPEVIDRCISCHLAVKFDHFSPTKIVLDDFGEPKRDQDGRVVFEENQDYVFKLIEDNIEELKKDETASSKKKIQELEKLLFADSSKTISLKKVLKMHPLMDGETRPFEFHPIETYGCTSCHSGNGRSLNMERAHGPVYDGSYETAHEGQKPQFLEKDLENDPSFSKVYNSKPGHKLLFQTTPILPGKLIEASCAQCHSSTLDRRLLLKDSLNSLKGELQERLAKKEFFLPEDTIRELKDFIKHLSLDDLKFKRDHIFHLLDGSLTPAYYRGQELFFSQGCYQGRESSQKQQQ